jgi:hypothetical protein
VFTAKASTRGCLTGSPRDEVDLRCGPLTPPRKSAPSRARRRARRFA